eukprot:TRINITY_DN8467_c0_g1_i1.p1 TRINITY_DN8467_c0_g1~~TRINITY_DN8467_c0_g1_i1.p1  ORF type:complete len:128 (+),score=31.19 TRINITY_DN8467_c0_g1_i1:44-427(+)
MSEYHTLVPPPESPSEGKTEGGILEIFRLVAEFFRSSDYSLVTKLIVFVIFLFALVTIILAMVFGILEHFQHFIVALVLVNNIVLDIYLLAWFRDDIIHARTVKILIALLALMICVVIHAYIWNTDC